MAGGQVAGRQGGAPMAVHCLSVEGGRGAMGGRAKSQKLPQGATKTDPHPFAQGSFPRGGSRSCRGGLPQHYYHLTILIIFALNKK